MAISRILFHPYISTITDFVLCAWDGDTSILPCKELFIGSECYDLSSYYDQNVPNGFVPLTNPPGSKYAMYSGICTTLDVVLIIIIKQWSKSVASKIAMSGSYWQSQVHQRVTSSFCGKNSLQIW